MKLFTARTFPEHPYFDKKNTLGQLDLFDVLHTYSIVDDELGYWQGMNFIAGLFVMHVSPH